MATSDGFIPVKPTKVVDVGLALLERDTVLAATVWRNAAGDFKGAKNDTITIKVPAYVEANKRALRSSAARVRSKLQERSIDIRLTHDLQVDVPLTDEELTLDLDSLATQVTAPALGGIVRAYESEVADLMADADYAVSDITVDEDDPYPGFVDARTALNDASVPMGGRYCVVGTNMENRILKSDRLSKFDNSGSDTALRDASIGRMAGFDIFVSNFLDPDAGIAYHRTAFALGTRAPAVPSGAAWAASADRGGFAVRVLQHLDTSDDIVNVVYHDAWVGSSIVEDHGEFNADGKFIPSTEPDLEDGTDKLFVRAVKLALPAS